MDIISNFVINKIKTLTKQQRIAIVSSLVAGFMAHGYAMGNNYIYHDATILNGLGTTFGLGRWALGYLGEINNLMFGNYHLPFLNIVLSLILIAFSSAVVIDALKVSSTFLSAFVGAIFAVYPVVTSTFAYNFSATFYFIALLLSVMSINVIERDFSNKKNVIIAIILLTLSAGFYQAYLSVAVTLALVIIITDLVKAEKELSQIVRKGVTYVISFIISLILYLIVNKISLVIMKPPATGYQGAENMGALSLAKIPGRFIQTYLHFFYIKWNGINANAFMWLLIIVYLAISAILIIAALAKKKLAGANIALVIAGLIVMPIAVNLVYLMSTDDNYSIHTLMRFATVFIIILPAVLIEILYSEETSINQAGILRVPVIACSVLLIAITMSYIYTNNVSYIKMNLVQEEMNSFFTVLEARICMVDGFEDEMPVVFYGESMVGDNNLYDMNEMYPDSVILGYEYNALDLINRESWKRYMAYHTGFAPNVIDMPADIAESEEFANLKVYPDADSIQVIKGIIVVKLSQ